MRFTGVRERAVPISRYADAGLPSGGLDTSIVALETDVVRDGARVVGYGFSSIGRYAQSGLIRERFAPRLLAATEADLRDPGGSNLDPFRAWQTMMAGEKPGGHGERCVAVGTLDMAVWDAAAKIARLPLHHFLAHAAGRDGRASERVRVYASGGYPYPHDDLRRLEDEVRALLALGYTRLKIKLGAATLAEDRARIECVLGLLSAERLAVDAMNRYDAQAALHAAAAFAPYGLSWFEDVCDPLDFATLAAVARAYPPPLAAGEALFSASEAALLDAHGGLRRERDVLLFDVTHCYGIPGFLAILAGLEAHGWPRSAFWPHGGHLFTLHVVAALGLGGAETNPFAFAPFGGLADGEAPHDGSVAVPAAPGIGFETKGDLAALFAGLA